VLSAFAVLPFGLRTHHDVGSTPTPGHAASAPVNFRPRVVLLRATLVSAALFALFYANFYHGWVTAADLDVSRLMGID
jgi:predicted secreted protein